MDSMTRTEESTVRPAAPGARGTVAVHALGCKANQEEMECLLSLLTAEGYAVVPFGQAADWTVINTCTVTTAGDSDSRQMIRRAASGKGDGRVVVTGCLAQRDPRSPASIPGVDWVLGNAEKSRLAEWILRAGVAGDDAADSGARPADGPPWVRVSDDPTLDRFPAYGAGRDGRRSRATLKIQDGCDEHCTFCVIPSVRGRSRSRPLEDVLRQARTLVSGGYREISLTGINSALWGHDLAPRRELPDLAEALRRVEGLERLRLNSLEPQYLTPRWWDILASNPLVCPHYHLPLQSGSARILRRMNRGYGPGTYAALVQRICGEMPEAAVGADVLVGFPGEGEAEFEETAGLLASLPLAYLHVFSYSPRPGTASLRLGAPVPPEVRRERSRRLRALDRELRQRFRERQAGTVQTVLPEAPCGPGHWQGLAGNYLRVRFPWEPPPAAARALPLVLLQGAGDGRWMEGRTMTPTGTGAHRSARPWTPPAPGGGEPAA